MMRLTVLTDEEVEAIHIGHSVCDAQGSQHLTQY
jgi:hypothetical protein